MQNRRPLRPARACDKMKKTKPGGTAMVAIGNSWDQLLEPVFPSETYAKVRAFLKEEYKTHTVYPPARLRQSISNVFLFL